MSLFLKNASKEQSIIIEAELKNHHPLVVVAGAGSGKTTTIINKIGYMIEKQLAKPEEILAMSFSNKSAKELIDRVQNKIGTIGQLLTAGTFHSLSLNILKRYSPKFKNAKILDSEDDKKLIKKIYDKYFGEILKKYRKEYKQNKISEEEFHIAMDIILELKDIMWIISRSKNTNENIYNLMFEKIVNNVSELAITRPEKYIYYNSILFSNEEENKHYMKVTDYLKDIEKNYGKNYYELAIKNIKNVISIIKEYEIIKRKKNYLSFDDLLIEIVNFLKNNEKNRAIIDKKYKYIFIDEFQDVNYIQMEFLQLINKDYNFLVVVGDADQAIYSFRGCDSYYFMNMKNIYPNTKIYFLNDNYRSDGYIVDIANHSISHNINRYKKQMNAIKEKKINPSLISGFYETDLNKSIINKIEELNDFKNTAILYRNNNNSYDIQKELIKNNIPFKVVGGQNLMTKKYPKTLIAFLSILNNIGDTLSLERILGIFPKIGEKTIEKILENWENLNEEEKMKRISLKSTLFQLYSLLDKYIKRKESLISILDKFVEQIIIPDIKNKTEANKIDNEIDGIYFFQNIIVELIKEDKEIEDILDLIVLDNVKIEDEENVVTLTTIHRSKGLEWEHVFFIKAYKNILPSFNSMQNLFLLEEERNVFYVGITRAKTNLFFCLASFQYNGLEEKQIHASPFLTEIEDLL